MTCESYRMPSRMILCLVLTLAISSCGGGGGGGGSSLDGDSSWLVSAGITQDGCGDRIAPVTQIFTITTDGDIANVDTSLVSVQGTFLDGVVTAGYSDTSGNCTHNHSMEFSNIDDTNAEVFLASETNCSGGVNCVNTWNGTATKVASAKLASINSLGEDNFRVRGENCIPPIPQVGYRPSLFECNGAAAVLMRDSLRNNYSVVVRRNGQFNDRDPANPTCGTNRCSPYKTQRRVELPEYQVNCLGDSGFSTLYDEVLRISVKFSASVSDANDPSQFEQYCLDDVESSLN